MPPKTVKFALADALENLSDIQFKKFCFAIGDRREEPRVKRQALEGKHFLEVADVLVENFTEPGAKKVALETLKAIGCNEQRDRLAKDTSEGSLTSVSLMPPKTVKLALADALENLSDIQFKKFCFTIAIGCNEQRERLSKDTSEGSLTFVSRYGDIMIVETTGASMQTAQQDKLKYSGIKASYAMAETDLIEINNYKSIIKNVARQKGLDPALIAALISRSCRAGKTLTGGRGCYDEKRQTYNTYGLMQIDVNPNGGGHTPKGSWDSEEHLCQATDILLHFMLRIKHAFPDWSKEQQLKGGIAAYNAGDGNIHSYENLDAKTTGGDYSNDVVARAQWYKSNAGF